MGDDERKRKKTGSPPQPHPRSVILPWLCFYGCCSSFSFSTKQTHLSISPHKVYDNYRFFFFLSLPLHPALCCTRSPLVDSLLWSVGPQKKFVNQSCSPPADNHWKQIFRATFAAFAQPPGAREFSTTTALSRHLTHTRRLEGMQVG